MFYYLKCPLLIWRGWESKIVVKPSPASALFRKSFPDLQSTNQKDLAVSLKSYSLGVFTNPYHMRRKMWVKNGRRDRRVVKSLFLKCFDWKEWQKEYSWRGEAETILPYVHSSSRSHSSELFWGYLSCIFHIWWSK